LLLLAVMLAMACILVFSYLNEVEAHRATESDRLRVLANVIATNVETNLQATDLALEGVIRDFLPGPHGMDRSDDVNRRLSALESAMPGVRAIVVLDAHGKIVAASKRNLLGTDLSGREYFKRARANPDSKTFYISAPFQSLKKEPDLVITASRMVVGPAGQFNGLVVAAIDRAYFASILAPVMYAPDVWAYVVHGDGRQLLNFPENGRSDGVDLNRPGTLFSRHLQSGKTASVISGPVYTTKEQRMMALRTVQPAALHMDRPIVIGLSRSSAAMALPLQSKGLTTLLSFVLLGILGSCALYWMQSRRTYIEALGADLEQKKQEAEERIKYDFALRESEARFRTLIEDAPLAIAILRRGHFEYTNPRYRALHGYGVADDLNGMPWNAMLAPQSRAALGPQQALIDVDSPIEQMFEALGLGKDGALVPVFKTTTRVELADGPATLIFAQDISAQKHAESALLQARDAAEAANRSKADFLANMSHEIRSPLNAILGLAYLLEQARLETDARNMVHKIRASGRTLLGIINDVLDVSKIEAGHMVLEQAPFRLSDVIDSVAAAMGVAAGDKDIDLIIQPPPAEISYVMGDALRLEQVLVNLISNAVKFTQQGKVELRVEVASRDEHKVVLRFCVDDTGIGIAPAHQGEVFSAFMQADSSTTRRFGGTGLGLAICRQLVALMGGEIGLNSTLGQGSQFWFTLPMLPIPDSDFSSAEMVCVEALIADDSAIALHAAGAIAQGLGWQVDAVESGESALSHVRARKGGKLPNVVILDWKMPGMDGLATARAIRESVPAEEWPVVIMATAYSLSELSSRAGVEMVDAILTKPITASGLYNAVIEAQHRRAATVGIPRVLRQTASHGLEGIRVLIVDDSEINREVAQLILREQGAIVELAFDGQAALDWLLAHPDGVDLVLMDVQMPVMDGIEATRRLRQLPQFKDLPVVALTAGAFKSQQDAARAAGMNEFISKPFDVPSTIALIQRLCRRSDLQRGAMAGAGERTVEAGSAPAPALPAAPAVDSPAGAAAEAAPLDFARGMQIWSDEHIYRDYLRRFMDGYRNAAELIAASLHAGDRQAAAALVHKLAGVAANLALLGTQQAAGEAERLLAFGQDAMPAVERLARQLALAVAAIERFAPPEADEAEAEAGSLDMSASGQAARKMLLTSLMKALDTDDPAPVEPILGALASQLHKKDLAAIWACVRGFDFRGAEGVVRQLAAQNNIILGE